MIKVSEDGLVFILQKQGIITVVNGTSIQQNFNISHFFDRTSQIDINKDYLAIFGTYLNSSKIMLFNFYNKS